MSYANIFDQYKVLSLTLHINAVTQPAFPASTSPYSILGVAPDYDDSAGISYANILNYASARLLPTGRSTVYTIKPQVIIGGTTANRMVSSPWIDFADPDVPHYGFKIAVKQSTSTNTSYWWAYLEVEFLAKYVR